MWKLNNICGGRGEYSKEALLLQNFDKRKLRAEKKMDNTNERVFGNARFTQRTPLQAGSVSHQHAE